MRHRAMDLRSTPGSLLFVLGLGGICMGFIPEDCYNYKLQFERVFSVPGDMAMLSSTLVSSDVFNTTVPYNITWYDSKTGREICDQAGRILVRRDTLWFLNITLDDDGEYVTILRTPTQCYRQDTKLVVDLPNAGECGRPRKAGQTLTMRVTDTLVCPLKDYIKTLDSYNITSSVTWQRGCDPIVDGTGSYTYRNRGAKLKIDGVEPQHNTPHTCTLTFTLGGITGTVSETIDAWVKDEYTLVPEVREPASELVKAQMGSSFSKRCLVFVPCVGKPHVDIFWLVGKKFIFTTNSSARIYTSKQNSSKDDFRHGVWLERVLTISELREEDFNINYTCRAYSDRGFPEGHFTLLPADPNIILPIGVVLGGVMVLFIISVCIYYQFKVDIVLGFRSAFPIFYTNTDLDGKLYDAYVAYPSSCAFGYSKDVAMFALHTLPQVLENTCGYKLFIAGRDCLPGQAIVDSVEENIQASRCLLLLYTASTFSNKRHTSSTSCNNNNISEISESNDNTESKSRGHSSCTSSDGGEEFYPDTRQQLERVAAMHRALLEKSLKVVLVELEEITPAQLALFPESVRHLRKKQGAVCWWKNQRPRQRLTSCMRTREDEEKAGEDMQVSSSLSPSLRFWKELRYHMPVRGKRVVYPEKMALLNL